MEERLVKMIFAMLEEEKGIIGAINELNKQIEDNKEQTKKDLQEDHKDDWEQYDKREMIAHNANLISWSCMLKDFDVKDKEVMQKLKDMATETYNLLEELENYE